MHKVKQKGYVALVIVLTISVVALTTATTIALLGIGEAQSSLALSKGEDVLQFVEGCMEDALLKAKNDVTYIGGNITRPEGTCTVTVSKNGNNWTLTASTTATAYKRTVQAQITRTGNIAINNWREL